MENTICFLSRILPRTMRKKKNTRENFFWHRRRAVQRQRSSPRCRMKSVPDERYHGYAGISARKTRSAESGDAVSDKGRRAFRPSAFLINDILDMSRIEAGKVELECKAFSLKNWVSISTTCLPKRWRHAAFTTKSNLRI